MNPQPNKSANAQEIAADLICRLESVTPEDDHEWEERQYRDADRIEKALTAYGNQRAIEELENVRIGHGIFVEELKGWAVRCRDLQNRAAQLRGQEQNGGKDERGIRLGL